MSSDKAELLGEVRALQSRLSVAAGVEKAIADRDGRPFDAAAFILGQNLEARYPSGPAFMPYAHRPTLANLTAGIRWQDWAATAVGSAALYGIGFKHGMY